MKRPIIQIRFDDEPISFILDGHVMVHILNLNDGNAQPLIKSGLANPAKKKSPEPKQIVQKILSGYLNRVTQEVTIEKTPEGKPYLAGNTNTLQFNYSHSGDYLALAVTSELAVGVDLEKIHDFSMLRNVLKRTSPESYRYFEENFPEENQYITSFYKYWTTNEALQKCVGLLMPDTFYPYSEILPEEGLVRYHGHELWYERLENPYQYMMSVAIKF